MAADSTLDYDDIISQNILIRKDQDEDSNHTVEVVKKQNEDYENLYNIQAAMYQDRTGAQSDEGGNSSEEEDTSDFDYEVENVAQDESPHLSESCSDVEWNPEDEEKSQSTYKCTICQKRCPTKRGLNLHTIKKHAKGEKPEDAGQD